MLRNVRILLTLGVAIAAAACTGVSGGEGEGEGAAEGEGAEGEGGEGEGPVVSFQFETSDGSAIGGAVLDIGSHAVADGAFAIDLALRNTGAADFAILTEPPLLVAGFDAPLFSVVSQPGDVVKAGLAVPFTIAYAPQGAGTHEGKFLFAYGVDSSERGVLTVDAVATGGAGEGEGEGEGAGEGEGEGAPQPTPGLIVNVYDGVFAQISDITTVAPTTTEVLPTFDISERVGTDNFGFTFDGFVRADSTGDYTFMITSDDGSRLSVDGAVVCDNDLTHGAFEVDGTVALTAGLHAIHVDFFEGGGAEQLTVEWQTPDFARELVRSDHLFQDNP